MTLAEVIQATIKCPKCKRTQILTISSNFFEQNAEGGLMKLAMDHGDHIFVVWIDKNGMQRSTDVLTVIKEKPRDEKGEYDKILKAMDLILDVYEEDILARIIAASIIGLKIYVPGESDITRPLYLALTYIIGEFPSLITDIKEADVVAEERDKRIPGEKYFLEVIRSVKSVSGSHQKILKLKRHVEKILELSNLISKKLTEATSPISVVKLQKDMKVKDTDLFSIALKRTLFRKMELADKVREKHYIL